MSNRKEGVKDPIRVASDCHNAVVEGWPYSGPDADTIYDVDDDGYLRDDAGELVPFVGPGVVATGVDPETWGEHYHNPADCPEKDLPTRRPARTTCSDCTVAVKPEHDSDYYEPEREEIDADSKEIEAMIRNVVDEIDTPEQPAMRVSKRMHNALQEER